MNYFNIIRNYSIELLANVMDHKTIREIDIDDDKVFFSFTKRTKTFYKVVEICEILELDYSINVYKFNDIIDHKFIFTITVRS
jgi:hypothetical protein